MKTCDLTRSRAQNDPINYRIQGFSFRDFKNEVRCLRYDFFQFSQPNDLKHSSDVEMRLEEDEFNSFSDCDV